MKDRIPLYPGRVKLNPVAGEANTYDMVRADQPTQEGTALNKANLLNDNTAEGLYLGDGEPTPDLAFKKMLKNVQVNPYRHLDKAAGTFWEQSNIKAPRKDFGWGWYIEETNTIVLGAETKEIVNYSSDGGKTYASCVIDPSAKDSTAYINTIKNVCYKNGNYYALVLNALYKSTDFITWEKIVTIEYEVLKAVFDGERIVFLTPDDNFTQYFHYIDLKNESVVNRGCKMSSKINRLNDTSISYSGGKYIVISGDGDKVFWTDDCTKGTPNVINTSSWHLASCAHYFDGKFYAITSSSYSTSNGHKFYLQQFSLDGGSKSIAFTDYLYYSSASGIDPFFEINGTLYFCAWFAISFPKETPATIYKVDSNTIKPESVQTVTGSAAYQPLSITNSEKENNIFIAGYTSWETYDVYITEDYLTDMAGNNLTLSPAQSPIHIETGSYTGTGTYGESNPNSLTFGFEPKLVLIYVDSPSGANGYFGHGVAIQGSTVMWAYGSVAYRCYTTWSGKTLSWYCDHTNYTSIGQLNYGVLYRYIAFG